MSEGLNHVSLIGNLGADPELKYTQGNEAVLRLRLACNESFKGRDGQRQEHTEWISVVVWGRTAEAIAKILVKGRQIAVVGSLTTRTWEDRDGNRRSSTEVRARRVIALGPKPDGAPSSSRRDRGREEDIPHDDFADEDIPF